MKVLFTPIGGSDPMNRMRDGAMLHSIRVYKPDVIYMYFTDKMWEYEQKDNRYTWAVGQLKTLDGFGDYNPQIKIINGKNKANEHLFDTFYDEFEPIFNEMLLSYPDADFYANASSGTPAMKSAIVVISAMLNSSINVIQVSSGEMVPMHDRDNNDTYDKQEQWDCNYDNTDEFYDRTKIVNSDRFLLKVKKDNLKKCLLSYDYRAAYFIGTEIKSFIDDNAIKLLKAAVSRYELDYESVKDALKGTGYKIFPVTEPYYKRDWAEYLLWLDITLKHGDYISFLRGITPIEYEIHWEAVKKYFGDITKYCDKCNAKQYKLRVNKLKFDEKGIELLDVLNEGLRDKLKDETICAPNNMLVIINHYLGDDGDGRTIKLQLNSIREADSKLRNKVAHTITKMTKGDIIDTLGVSPEALFEKIKSVAVKLDMVPNDIWDSYDRMNQMIIDLLG